MAGAKSLLVITRFSRNLDPACSGECKSCHENLKIETQACGLSKDLHAAFNSNISTEVNMLQSKQLPPKNVKIKCIQVSVLWIYLPPPKKKLLMKWLSESAAAESPTQTCRDNIAFTLHSDLPPFSA